MAGLVHLVVSLNVSIFKDKIVRKLGAGTHEITFTTQFLLNVSQKNLRACAVI